MPLPRVLRTGSFHLSWSLPILAMVGLSSFQPQLVRRAQDQVFDEYQRLRPRAFAADLPVKIIDVDDASIGRFGQWPWPRSRIAELVDRLAKAKVAAIAFDMVFSEPDRTSVDAFLSSLPTPRQDAVRAVLGPTQDNDSRFAQALADAPAVLGMILAQGDKPQVFAAPFGFATAGDNPRGFVATFSGAIVPLTSLLEKAPGLGAVNWLPDDDQIVRRVPLVLALGDRLVPSLAMESIRVAQAASTFVVRSSSASGDTAVEPGVQSIQVGAVTAASASDGSMRLHFTEHRPERFLSAGSVLAGEAKLGDLEGAVVVIGSSAPGLADIRATPVDAAMPGVEIQAQSIETILTQSQLTRPRWALVECLIGALLAIALAFLLPFVSAMAAAIFAALCATAIVAVSWWAFAAHNLLIDPVIPSATIAVTYLAMTTTLFRAEQRDRRFVQNAFGRFVSPAVVTRLTREPRSLALGGELRELTVMFTDIRNFSALAERMSASDLTRFLNRYLSPMTEIILKTGGTLDKYIGDAIMAFWNAPLPDPAHAEHALRAALAMLDELPKLGLEADGSDATVVPLRCGIGLASGPCVVGNFGSKLRFDYSALGDDVNLASRLESLTKVYGLSILATEATRTLAPSFAWLTVETVVVAGRSTPTALSTVLGDETVAQSQEFLALASAHEAMQVAYRLGDHKATLALLSLVRAIAPASLHVMYDRLAERCRDAAQNEEVSWNPIRQQLHK